VTFFGDMQADEAFGAPVDPAPEPGPQWLPRVTVGDGAAVGRPVELTFRLEPADRTADARGLPPLLLFAVARSAGRVVPAAGEYQPGGQPTVFEFTAHEPGAHCVRFTVLDAEFGVVLQDLTAEFDVPNREAS